MFKKRLLCGLLIVSTLFSALPSAYISGVAAEKEKQSEHERVLESVDKDTGVALYKNGDKLSAQEAQEMIQEIENTKVEKPSDELLEQLKLEENPTPNHEYILKYLDSTIYWRRSTASRGLYVESDFTENRIGQFYCGESVEELISMLNDDSFKMVPLSVFFKNTTFENITEDTLLFYAKHHITLDMVIDAKIRYNEEKQKDEGISFVDYLKGFLANTIATKAEAAETITSNVSVSKGTPTKTGNTQSNNVTGVAKTSSVVLPKIYDHEVNVWMLSINGAVGFCGEPTKTFTRGLNYSKTNETAPLEAQIAYNYYVQSDQSEFSYDLAQIYIWSGANWTIFKDTVIDYFATKDKGYE